jgi:serine/threonine protein kinase
MTDSLRERVIDAIGQLYEIGNEIGRGGMSVVYEARDIRLNRRVAIKVLPPELAFDPAVRLRFTREAQMAAQLSHPHIVPIYDVGDQNGIAYFVMTLIAGGNLATLLSQVPRQPIAEVRRLLCEVADALDYAHQHGVIHRDIKPDNILLDNDSDRAVVTDFGIARAMEGHTRLTVTGIAVGTPAYMSPEQAVGERELDGRSDIYSLGVLAYQMLTGRTPFSGANSMALLLKHISEAPRPIAELRPETPRPLREAVERAMMKEREDRWPNANAFRSAISSDEPMRAWRGEDERVARSAGPADTPRRERTTREPRNDVRYVSPRRGSAIVPQKTSALQVPTAKGGIIVEPEHLAVLTPPQREDLRLWHGRIHLLDRVKAARGYLLLTVAAAVSAMAGLVGAFEAEIPPLVFGPLVPIFMSRKLWRRCKSLRESGLRLRRVFLLPRAKMVLPGSSLSRRDQKLLKLAPRDVLDGQRGEAIIRAVDDRAAILDLVAHLPKNERAFLPDVGPTVKALVDRVVHLAKMLHNMEQSIDWRLIDELDSRIADAASEGDSPTAKQRFLLLQKQRATLDELVQRRSVLARQLESAGLALANLRLDLINLRSSGLQSALSEVSAATQAARALSSDIGAVLDAAAEVRSY